METSYDRFAELLNKKGITPYRVHKDTGIATATLSDWKNGISVPKIDKMNKIADYFGVSLEYLMAGKESDNHNDIDTDLLMLLNDVDKRVFIEILKSNKSEQLRSYAKFLSEQK